VLTFIVIPALIAGIVTGSVLGIKAATRPGPGFFAGLSTAAVDPSGSLYVGITDKHQVSRIYRVNQNGALALFAGNGEKDGGDGGPAVSAGLENVQGLTFDSGGNAYFFAGGNGNIVHGIRKITPDGVIATVVGGGTGRPAQGMQAREVSIDERTGTLIPHVPAIGPNGLLYFSDGGRVWMVGQDGRLALIAGMSQWRDFDNPPSPDGSPATEANLSISAIGFDGSGRLLVADGYRDAHFNSYTMMLRRIESDGLIATIYNAPSIGRVINFDHIMTDWNGDVILGDGIRVDGGGGDSELPLSAFQIAGVIAPLREGGYLATTYDKKAPIIQVESAGNTRVVCDKNTCHARSW